MDMTPDQCVSEVARLLELFPGVRVRSAVHGTSECNSFFDLSITSLQSLARLVVHCNAGANVALEVQFGGASVRDGQPVDEAKLHYTIVLRNDDGRGSFADPPGPLHIFGIFLARDLKRLGLIPAEEADKLQRAWHGAVM